MGTGLGLSLVRAFAELHGGTMTIKSLVGEGTAVSVRMPVLDHVAMGLGAPAPAAPFDDAPPEPAPDSPSSPPRAGLGDNVIAFTPHR
jgi:cell cycle sensor histidine kinase DivJ